MEDLSLVPFDDLWNEITKRFDHAVFSGFKNSQQNILDISWRYKGAKTECIAAAELIKTKMATELVAEMKPMQE